MQSFHRQAKQKILVFKTLQHKFTDLMENCKILQEYPKTQNLQKVCETNWILMGNYVFQLIYNIHKLSGAEQLCCAVVVHSLTLILAVRGWLRTGSCWWWWHRYDVLVLRRQQHLHTNTVPSCFTSFTLIKTQDDQLSQRDRAAGCVIVFTKNRRLELGDKILQIL